MKKLILILLLLSSGIYAQGQRHEKIKALKIAFITEQLDLSSAEAEKFWPIYNEFDNKMNSIRLKHRKGLHEREGGIDNMTEAEANELLDKSIEFKTLELDYSKKLVQDLRQVIPAKKIIKLKRVEEEFKRRLLERFRERQNNKNRRP